uniref:Uncharacterized protein n=1 Tax=Parascaris univalens TaxID=6257 RepID=A0A915CBD4_PARUN
MAFIYFILFHVVEGYEFFHENISNEETSFSHWSIVNNERIKLEKLQDEISARLHSYRPVPFFMVSTVLCTLILMTGIILIQASNVVKSKYSCRKSNERFRKLWAEETAKDEAASCVADIDFTYADARPGLICRLHPAQLDAKQDRQFGSTMTAEALHKNSLTTHEEIRRIPRWIVCTEAISSGILLLQLIFFGMCTYHMKNSFEMIEKFCEEDLTFCQQSRFKGHLKGIPNDAAHQLHAEVRNAFGVYASHIVGTHSNYHYMLIMIYVSCIITCGYIFSSLCSSIAFYSESDGSGNVVIVTTMFEQIASLFGISMSAIFSISMLIILYFHLHTTSQSTVVLRKCSEKINLLCHC